MCALLAKAIVNAQVLLDLELVLLAGGAMRGRGGMLEGIRVAYAGLCPDAFRGKLQIEAAQLGEWAGAVGAAALWLDRDGGGE